MDKREILERVSKTPIIINGSGIVEMDSFGDVSVNGKSIRDTMVEVLGTGNEPYSAVNFAGSVRIEITPFPNKDLHIVEEVQND